MLKSFVPETFVGLPKKSGNAEKSGLAGLLGLAGWVGLQGEKDDDNGSERTQKVDGRLVHERLSKKGGTNEFGVVLGDRFVVSAKGRGVPISELKSAVSSIDLVKLESMKGIGVTK